MNKIIILCAVLSSVLFAEIDERKSDIYYGNGIMTTKAEARASKELIKTATLNDIYHGDQVKMDKLHTFDLAYNYSAKEKFENTMIATVLDLMESYEQMGNTSFGWGAVTSVLNLIGGRIAIVSKWTTKRVSNFLVKEGVPALAASFLAKEIVGASKTRLLEMAVNFFQYDPTEIHDNNLKEMVEKYTTSIKDGHGIILVTHSQGNLFAIEATNRVNFSMGIQAFKPWMRNYVHHVSIASPATKFASDNYWLTSLDNDVVANNPGAVGPKLRNPIRYFTHKADSISPAMNIDATREWTDNPPLDDSSPDGYWLDKVTPPSFTKTVQADSGFGTVGVIQDFTMHVVPEEWEYSATEFHALNYYMGLTAFQANIGGGKKVKQKSDETRKKIIEDLESAIQKHKDTPSQWGKDEVIGCGCDRKITLKHIELYGGIYSLMQDIKVMEFQENGKVYQVDGQYIKANPEGTAIDNQTSLANGVCYLLDGTDDKIDGSGGLEIQPHSGVLEASLSWENPEIELKLRVSGPTTGIYDMEQSECPNRHWYIATEDEVKEGTYYISINNIGTTAIDENLFPQTISFSVGAPDGGVEFTIDAQSASELDMGAVAKVTISKQTTSNGGSNSVGISVSVEATKAVKSSPFVSLNAYRLTSEGERYDYKTESLLSKVEFGPIAGAVFEIGKYNNPQTVIYTGATSSGYSLQDNGLMLLPANLKDAVEDEELYLITVKGGQDIDANDDFVMDSVPTINLGEVHAIISGADIKKGGLKVNVMTEIAYQVFAQSNENNLTKIKMGLDKIAQKLLKDDINFDKTIDRVDLHSWLPGFDKEKLHVNYSADIEPIVQKVYHNEDIYGDVDKLVVPLVADAGEDIFIGVAPTLKLDGSKSHDINGDIVEYLWMEGNTLLCSSDKSICEIDMLSLGQHFITLTVSDNGGNTQDDTLNITINSYAPIANAGVDQEIFEDGTITLDGSSSYDGNGNIVEYLWMVGETVYCQSDNPVCIVENLSVSNDYTFVLKVTDNEGYTGQDDVNIVYPYKPVSVAGSDISISFGESVTLNGSSSYDNDGYIVEYQWREGDKIHCYGVTPICIVNGLTTGTHLFELQVKDEKDTIGNNSLKVEVLVKNEAFAIGSFTSPQAVYSVTLSKDENTVYLGSSYAEGLQIIDVSNPVNPSLIGSYNTPGPASTVALSKDENIAYVPDETYGLQIIDVSSPAFPLLLGVCNTPGDAMDVVLSKDNSIAYVADGSAGLQLIDVINPGTPVLLGNYDISGTTYSVALSQDNRIAYVAGSSGIYAINVEDSETPSLIGSYFTSHAVSSITISLDGNIAYIANGYSGLQIIDISAFNLSN